MKTKIDYKRAHTTITNLCKEIAQLEADKRGLGDIGWLALGLLDDYRPNRAHQEFIDESRIIIAKDVLVTI